MPCSVLVVDDDPCFRELMRALLVAWGYDVLGEAGSVGEALSCADALGPDVVLVDVGLPDGDGFALAQRLRALARPPRVVLISSDSDAASAPAAHRAGACGFLSKDQLTDHALRPLVETR